MKRILIFLIIILCIGCSNEEINDISNVISESIEKSNQVPTYVDTNPIKVGLYKKGKLVKEINTKFKDRTDLTVLNVIFSNEEDLGSTNLKENWKKYYNKYENIDDYKIGFYIEMEANGTKMSNLILDPSNRYKLEPYIYYYLYDGIHASGKYTHLDMKDLKDDTIYSSIKIYMYSKSNLVSSPIYLTVFTYKDENDFLNDKYRGNSFYTIKINNVN